MNKLIIFPLAVLGVISLSTLAFAAGSAPGGFGNQSNSYAFANSQTCVPDWFGAGGFLGFLGCLITQTSTSLIFNVGVSDPNTSNNLSWLVLIFILIGIAIIASLTVLGSGENPAGTNAILQAAAYLGVWILLASIASPSLLVPDTVISLPYGPLVLGVLSLIYLLGIVGQMKMGGTV